MKTGIATRQALYVMLLALGCGIISGIAQVYLDITSERSRQLDNLERFVSLHRPALASAVYNLDKKLAEEALQSLAHNPIIQSASLIDDFGDSLATVTNNKTDKPNWVAKLGAYFINIPAEKRYKLDISNLKQRFATLQVSLNEISLVEGITSRATIILTSTVLFTAILTVLILFVSYLLLSKPIVNIAHWIGGAKTRADIENPPYAIKDELGLLVERFQFEWQANHAASAKLEAAIEQISRNEKFSRSLMENSGDAMFLCRPSTEICQVNRLAVEITGQPSSEIVGKYAFSYSELYDSDEMQNIFAQTANEAVVEYEDVYFKDTSHYLECRAVALTLSAEDYVLVNVRDVTRRKLAERQIYQMAYFDSLTNLANRRMLTEKLESEMESHIKNHQYGALLYFDLDRFKYINDSMGHMVGDSLLKEISTRLRQIAPNQSMASRLGGDEFVLALFQLADKSIVAAEKAQLLAQQLLEVLARPFTSGGLTLHSTCSIGICLFPGDGLDAGELLRCADTAMYRAKAMGRNSIEFYRHEMQSDATQILQLEDELHAALNYDQLAIWLQPQVTERGELFGAEILVRWNHPTKGLVMPGAFIPQAEESGLIVDIDKWVLRESIRFLSHCREQGLMANLGRVSINISPIHFQQVDFVSYILNQLRNFDLPGDFIELEITENMLLNNFDIATNKMATLKQAGVTFAIDDFGTGYSSLKYLNELPLEVLKVDRSFVQGLSASKSTQPIIEVVITTATKLGMSVIAEGVETQEQVDTLSRLECSKFQGYFFGKPVSKDQFITQWLNES
ncbi:putative bifunctional diguanylate cyclase/phosphodiesterase [Vibrio viridaestus]|nr:EAL domain-containing protein [Vibrio viridaestus]